MRRRGSQVVAVMMLVAALGVPLRQALADLERVTVDDVMARAKTHQNAGRFAEGQQVLEAALGETAVPEEQHMLRLALADLHFVWARSLAQRSAYQEAIPHYQATLAIDEMFRRRNAALDLMGLGAAYRALDQDEQAITYFEQALVIRREVGDRTGEGATLNNLGAAHEALNQHDQAIAFYDQALAIAREVGNRVLEGMVLHNLSETYEALSQYNQAITYYEQALAIWREIGDRTKEGKDLNNLGDAHVVLSQYNQAITYYEQALVIAREVGDRTKEGRSLNNLGDAYEALNQYAHAMTYLEQALAIAREVGNKAWEGKILADLGFVYGRLSQYAQAMTYLEQALAIAREVGNRAYEGGTLKNLGAVYNALSQYGQAIAFYEQALVIWREIGNKAWEGITLSSLGIAYRALNQYEQAMTYLEQALAIQREIGNKAWEGRILTDLGNVYRDLSQYEQAMTYLEQALAIHREVKDRFFEGVTLYYLSAVSQELNQYEQAMTYLEQALAITREVGDRDGEGNATEQLMHGWKAQQKPRLAIFYGKQAINVFQAIRGDIQTLDKTLQRSFLTSRESTYRTLAELLISAGRLPEAQQVLDLLKDEEYFNFVRRDAQTAETLQGRAALTPLEAEWAERYRVIADRVTAIGRERRDLLAKERNTALTAAEEQQLEALEADLRVATQAFQQSLNDLAAAFSSDPASPDRLFYLREAQGLMADLAELGPGTVALYTLVTDEHYRVIVITPEAQVAREYPITASALHCKVHAFREVLRTVQNGGPVFDPRPLAQELYQILVGPVARDLEGAKAQTLMWVLDGVLRYLPVAALHDGEQYLVERYRTVIFTPASQARLKDTPSPTWTGLGLGVSQAHGDFKALPAVPKELHGIIRDAEHSTEGVLQGTIKLDEAFTTQAMFAALRQRPPVVHIASHFQFRPGNETDSFLLLGDGNRLSLAQLKERSDVFHGVDLLTLSACDTAMGGTGATGKEVEGFGVLAQRQGAKAVVASLWPVADASTKDLMQTFYRLRESQPGLPKVEALRQAQLALLHGQELSAPGVQVAALDQPVSTEGNSAAAPRDLDLSGLEEARKRCGRAEPSEGCGDVAHQPCFTRIPQAPYAHPYYWAPFILIGNWK